MLTIRRLTSALTVVATAVVLQLSAATSYALVVDQSNTPVLNFSRNIDHFAPMGQEFTPTLLGLNVVELLMEDASCSLVGGPGGSALVRIHASTIEGQVVGTSAVTHFPNCFGGVLRFDFASVAPLVPGELYVLESVYVAGDTSLAASFEGLSTYAGGRAIIQGIPHADEDLWFREGLEVPEPDTWLLYSAALIVSAARPWRRRRHRELMRRQASRGRTPA